MKALIHTLILAIAPLCLAAQSNNSWNNSAGGNWDQASSWSEDALPNSSQGVVLNGPGTPTIVINAETAQNYPGSMAVGLMAIENGDTLLLEDGETNLPFWAGNIAVEAQGANTAAFNQVGSIAEIAGEFYLAGSVYMYPWPGTPASYSIANGAMSAQSLVLDGTYGNCNVTITNANVAIDGSLEVLGLTWCPSQLNLQSGTLACSDVVNAAGSMFINQTGGALVVSNLFVFDGYYPRPYNSTYEHVTYGFTGGTLAASNIQIDAEWNIGSSSQPGRISNPGYFRLSGILDVGNASEQLGGFILATSTNYQINSFGTVLTNLARTNAQINFTGTTTTLAFAKSSAEVWSNSVSLLIYNWSGSPAGGGREQLKFGADATGLTAAQLSQIQFINPAGLPNGVYAAVILGTGEVVPYAPNWLQITPQNGALVLNWQPGSALQTATEVIGPYIDVAGATPPFTNLVDCPQRFFRARSSQ